MTYHMIFNRSNKTGPTSGAGIAYPIPIFSGGRVAQSLVFCMIFCWSVLVFFWPWSIFDLHLLIIPLLFSNICYI